LVSNFVISGLSDAAYYWGRAELYRAAMTPVCLFRRSVRRISAACSGRVSIALGFAISLGARRIVALRRHLLKTTDHVGNAEPGA